MKISSILIKIIKETGYLEGVYTEQELQFENVKEKEAKIEFLQKLIDAVSKRYIYIVIDLVLSKVFNLHFFIYAEETSKDKLKAKPSKIVAGLEPERTNELLQAIGKAVDARQKEPNNNIVEPKASAASIKPPAIGKSKSSKTQSNPKEVNANSTKVAAKPVSSVQSESKLSVSAASVKQTKVTSRPTRAHDTKDKPPSIKVSKEKVVIKEPEIILQRSSTTTILREGETKQELIEDVVSNDHHDAASIKDNSPLPDDKTKVDDQGNINTKVVPMDETLGTNSSFETDAKNLTQVLSNTSVSIDTKPTETALPTSSTSDLIDVIDQEAEIRRRERSSKKHRETKSTAGQSVVAQDNPSVVAVDSPVVEEIKSSKPRKSLKIKRAISGEDVQEVVVVPQSTVRASSTEDHELPAVHLVRPRTSLRPPSVRPASARPGAPRRRDKNVEIFLQPDDAANQAAGNGRPSTFPEVDLEDDGDNLIVIEDPMVSVVDTMNGKNKGDLNGGNLGTASTSDDTTGHTELSDERGHLVQQILQTQKEFSKQDDNKEVINNTV